MQAIYVNHYLTDQDVANYARQSFAKLAENFTPEQNANLIRFLARGMSSGDWEKLISQMIGRQNYDDMRTLAIYLRKIPEHWVPFGHPHITLRVTAPVPIRVQCFKHKVGFVESEESRRYISMIPTYYMPSDFRAKAENVKQGSGGIHPYSENWKEIYRHYMDDALALYDDMIKDGVCPEQARFVLPQGMEVNWVWTGSLYAFANFFNQRSDPHAQMEIQELAKQIGSIIEPLFPISWSALTQGNY